jgi:hypothetical protein
MAGSVTGSTSTYQVPPGNRWASATATASASLVLPVPPGSSGAVAGGEEVAASLSYADHEQAWTAHASAGPPRKVVEIAGAEAVRQVMRDVLEADRKPDGQKWRDPRVEAPEDDPAPQRSGGARVLDGVLQIMSEAPPF